jgi:hypothetical protein
MHPQSLYPHRGTTRSALAHRHQPLSTALAAAREIAVSTITWTCAGFAGREGWTRCCTPTTVGQPARRRRGVGR